MPATTPTGSCTITDFTGSGFVRSATSRSHANSSAHCAHCSNASMAHPAWNVFGHLAVTQAFLPAIRNAGGRIVFMSSVGGRVPSAPFLSPYNASKHAIESFGDALRVELAPWGIHVSLIEPGSIATPIWDKSVSAAGELRKSLPPEAEERYGEAADRATKIAEATGRRGIPPERVAAKVALALTTARPRPRYMVGPDAKAQTIAFSLLTDRARDRLVARVMKLRPR